MKNKKGKTPTLKEQITLQLSAGMLAGLVIEADEQLAMQAVRQASEACRLGTPVVVSSIDPDLVEKLQNHTKTGKGVMVLSDLLRVQGNPIVARLVRDFALNTRQGGAYPRLILIEQPGVEVPLGLRGDIGYIIAELPTIDELKMELEGFLTANKDNGIKLEGNGEMRGIIANALSGVPRHTAAKLLNRCWAENQKLDPVWLSSAKAELVKEQSGNALSFIDVSKAAKLGGAEVMQTWLGKTRKTFCSDTAKAFGLDEPKGIVIVGIPGTGKSLTPKNISAEWGVPLIRFDISSVFGGLVGQTEAQLKAALSAIEACAPCILWVDEVEKALGGKGESNGDSGVSTRLVGTLLTWMQENEKPIFMVMTANSVESLRAELLRPGRIDMVFFMDLPDLKERMDIVTIHTTRLNRPDAMGGKGNGVGGLDVKAIAEAADGYSGAELEVVIKAAMKTALSLGRAVAVEDVLEALGEMTPLSKTKKEDVKKLREWAETHATYANKKAATEAGGDIKRVPLGGDGTGWTTKFEAK